MYAKNHDDFAGLMAEAAVAHLMEDVLTDDLFKPCEGFTPTAEEQATMNRATATAELLRGLFGGLAGFLKNT